MGPICSLINVFKTSLATMRQTTSVTCRQFSASELALPRLPSVSTIGVSNTSTDFTGKSACEIFTETH
jgi:hypothetical protein